MTASISNNQIYWIATDADIRRYLTTILAGNESRIEPYALEKLAERSILCEYRGRIDPHQI